MTTDPQTTADIPPEPADDLPEIRDLHMDPEALLLCSLMWVKGSPQPNVSAMLDYLHEADFYIPAHGRIFQLIAAQARAGRPLDAVSVSSRIDADGGSEIWPDRTHHVTLANLAGLGAMPEHALWYAEQVLAASYRRQFAQMAARCTAP